MGVAAAGALGPAARARRLASAFHVESENCDFEAPPKCTCRKYMPLNRSWYWRGVLPPNRTDDKNHLSMSAGWGFYTGRTQQEARDLVLDWLNAHGQP